MGAGLVPARWRASHKAHRLLRCQVAKPCGELVRNCMQLPPAQLAGSQWAALPAGAHQGEALRGGEAACAAPGGHGLLPSRHKAGQLGHVPEAGMGDVLSQLHQPGRLLRLLLALQALEAGLLGPG